MIFSKYSEIVKLIYLLKYNIRLSQLIIHLKLNGSKANDRKEQIFELIKYTLSLPCH